MSYSTVLEGLLLAQILISTSLVKSRMFRMAAASTYQQLPHKCTWESLGLFMLPNPGIKDVGLLFLL